MAGSRTQRRCPQDRSLERIEGVELAIPTTHEESRGRDAVSLDHCSVGGTRNTNDRSATMSCAQAGRPDLAAGEIVGVLYAIPGTPVDHAKSFYWLGGDGGRHVSFPLYLEPGGRCSCNESFGPIKPTSTA